MNNCILNKRVTKILALAFLLLAPLAWAQSQIAAGRPTDAATCARALFAVIALSDTVEETWVLGERAYRRGG